MPVPRGLNATTLLLSLALANAAADAAAADSRSTSAADPTFAVQQTPSLRQALKALQDAGLELIFSSALVQPELRLDGPVDPEAPLPAQARAMLEPFGLALKRTGADVYYVVKAAPAGGQSAGQAESGSSVPVLEEVVVTSSRYRLLRRPVSRRRLDSTELEMAPSIGRDLLRAVNYLPGQASMGVSARSHMRGGNTNEVLYLVDGVQLVEPFHMADFHALFSAISPALVETVDVYHAGFPAAYGTRLSGVVDMELTETEQPLEARINVDFVNASSQAQGQAGNTEWLISARRSTVDYLLDYVEQDYGRPKFHDELMRLSWQGEESDLTLGALYSVDELTLEDSSGGESARADYRNLVSWLRYGRELDEDLDLTVSGTLTAIDNERHGRLSDPLNAVGSLMESRDFTVASLAGALRWRPGDGWEVHAGLEAERQDAAFDVSIDSQYGLLGRTLQPAQTLARNVSADRHGTLLTAFLSVQRELTEALTVEYGWRYDAQNVDPVHDNQFSPRLHVAWDSGRWHAFLNVGRYAQHQNLYELQLDDGLLELADPQLADQVSLGADWAATARWRLRLEAYWREIDAPWSRFENLYNRWVLLPELHADRVSLMPDQARTYGGEALVDYSPTADLRWTVSLSVSRAQERLQGEWRSRPWEQRRTWRSSLTWQPGNWRIALTAAHHSGWPTTSLVTEPLSSLDRLYDDELPNYFSLDLHAARRFDLPASELEVYFDLTNATFAENVGGHRYELSGGRLVRDERMLLPPVPVLGMTWSW